MATNDLDRVVPLNQLDGYTVADGEPDVRGWEVISSDNRRVGKVDQLLVDTGAMKVRYLDVDVDDALVAGGDRHVLIPIGYARLEEGRSRVLVDSLAATDVAALPAYAHGPVARDTDDDFTRRFGAPAATGERASQARITRSEEELAVGKRETEAGEVQVHKHVETEHVSRPVSLAHEEVTVERRPVTDPGMAAAGRIEDEEIRVPLMEEEAVVEKRVVPKEELVVRKREVEETEVVEADLRKERVEVDREGDAREPRR
ncbi:MAG: DUF2382 domain-containing protein [Gemmatimonadetes bacterium]|nr:DUF2382 domain-containing protein [Gemmatimonadota bacterium]